MTRTILALVTYLVVNLLATAQNQSDYFYSPIRVQNPRNWNSDNGKITKTALSITPKGLYSKIDVEMTFAAYNPSFFGNDTLELSFDFNLPPSSFMIDSWLWIEDVPTKALLLDYGSATTTYEGIVKRRKDPSILTTWGGGYYSLKIYPMKATETRKVKLSYMVLNNWTAKNIYVPLPINLIGGGYGMDKVVPSNISLNVNETGYFKNAKLAQNTNSMSFNDKIDYKMQFAPQDDFTLVFDSPLSNGIYSKGFTDGKQGYFEMAFLPSQILDLTSAGQFTHFDLHTSLTNGITFDKTYLGSEIDNPDTETPILQLGSYKGDGSLTLTSAGELKDNIYSKTTTLSLNIQSDSAVRQVWANSKVAQLQNTIYNYYNNADSVKRKNTMGEIMKLSRENRLLNRNTAFLALEPGMEVVNCESCNNFFFPIAFEKMMTSDVAFSSSSMISNATPFAPNMAKNNAPNQLIPVSSNRFNVTINLSTNNENTNTLNSFSEEQINIYPNPSNGYLRIDISDVKVDLGTSLRIDFINAYGSPVKSFTSTISKTITSVNIDLTKENIASGIYQVVITSLDKNISATKSIIIP